MSFTEWFKSLFRDEGGRTGTPSTQAKYAAALPLEPSLCSQTDAILLSREVRTWVPEHVEPIQVMEVNKRNFDEAETILRIFYEPLGYLVERRRLVRDWWSDIQMGILWG